ncbi:MAG: hypothetical protein J6X28_04075 [Bacilli bacterium]|nr:hypothetical protein [Bacilli bacterium]
MEFLLNDEKEISEEDLAIRKQLYAEFMDLPENFVSKMRHLQPQVGCFNNCSFCSKFSVCKSEYWGESSLRNVICALKYTAKNYTNDDLLLAWDRREHRIGVIFPYLNNDIAAYPYLDQYISLCYRELGARTRISTVGFSRHNHELNEMHKRICREGLICALGGVRLSVSQYGRVWEEKDGRSSLEEYCKDIANFLSIYKIYFEKFGAGSRRMCCELRFNPLVENAKVIQMDYDGHFVLAVSNYLFVSQNENITLEETFIDDPYNHSLSFTNDGEKFLEYNLPFMVENEKQIEDFFSQKQNSEREVEVYLFKNKDGIYYSIDPRLTREGNFGMHIYPTTDVRTKSGYIVTERFFLNALYNFKKRRGLSLRDLVHQSSFDDCYEVVNILKEYSKYYQEIGKKEKSVYILEHVVPLIEAYIKALQEAGYSSDVFFDKNFTIDTGMICNLGRAISLFKGLTKFVNEPLTPTHERNYGRHCSTMKQENTAWLLACDFHHNLLIEQLDLFNTASVEGQVSFKRRVEIPNFNIQIDENTKYLFPGEVE